MERWCSSLSVGVSGVKLGMPGGFSGKDGNADDMLEVVLSKGIIEVRRTRHVDMKTFVVFI